METFQNVYFYLTSPNCSTTINETFFKTLDDPDVKNIKEEPKPAKFRPPKYHRTKFSTDQICILEAAFQEHNYLKLDRRKQLSEASNLTERQVKVWFQNRRAKERKKLKHQQKLDEKWNKYLLDLIQKTTVEPLTMLQYLDNCLYLAEYFANIGQNQDGLCPHDNYHNATLKCPCV